MSIFIFQLGKIVVTPFQKNLTSLLKSKGLRKVDLCRGTGIPTSTMTRYARGERKPTVDNLFSICQFFKVDQEWMMTGEGEESLVQEENVNIPVTHPDKPYSNGSDYSLIAKGTGMMTIGDVVQYVHDYGNAEEKEEMMFKKLEFIDTAKGIALRIRSRRTQQKKAQ